MKNAVIAFFILICSLSAFAFLSGGGSGGGIGGSTGSTDNALLRANGTGGSTVQSSTVTLGDTGAISNTLGADVIGLSIKGTSGQSANLVEFRNNSNTLLGFISPLGGGNLASLSVDEIAVDGEQVSRGSGATLRFWGASQSQPSIKFTDPNNLGPTFYTSLVGIVSSVADLPVLSLNAAGSQSAALLQFKNSGGTVVSSHDFDGAYLPPKYADSALPTCNSGKESKIVYNDTDNVPCFCNGTDWKRMDGSTACDL